MQIFVNKIDTQNIALSMAAMPDALANKVMKPVMDQMASDGAKK